MGRLANDETRNAYQNLWARNITAFADRIELSTQKYPYFHEFAADFGLVMQDICNCFYLSPSQMRCWTVT